jgi:glycosyltransferase involved in cell wall biosynthesis
MRIGFDGSRAFLKDRTGTENYSYQILANLAKIDHQNNYTVFLRPGSTSPKGFPDNFTFKTINYSSLWTQLGLALETFKTPLDILFVPAHTIPLIRKPGLKTLITVHDLGAEYLPKTHQIKQRLYLGFITNWQLKGATKLIAVSEATKKDLIGKVGLSSKKIKVVYEAVDKNIFKPAKNDALVSTLINFDITKEKYFFFVGTIQPRKNLARLIEAFAKFSPDQPEMKLVLAGSKGWLSDEIYSLPKKLNIEDKVKFIGRVTDPELVSLLTAASALTFPSLFEGFGLPILEAFACDCPVLTSNISSMPEVAGEAAVQVDPYSVEDIAEGLTKVLENRTKLIQLGKRQLEKFLWEDSARKTLQILTNT